MVYNIKERNVRYITSKKGIPVMCPVTSKTFWLQENSGRHTGSCEKRLSAPNEMLYYNAAKTGEPDQSVNKPMFFKWPWRTMENYTTRTRTR
jgi:hypothetical protein